MRRESEMHAADDANKREAAEARNAADTLAYNAERMLREQGDKVPAQLKQEVEDKVAAVRSALSGSDVSQIQRSTQELSEALQRVGTAIYQQAGPQPPPEEPEKKEEGTVEGEFREV